MLIFLTWSGERSKQVALALREALPSICGDFKPWMSEVDIATGTRWRDEIASRLDEAHAAILCLTPENQDERWVLFEAGAIAKSRATGRVTPYLFDLRTLDLKPPLADFQSAKAALDREENLKLVRSLWESLPEQVKRIDEARLAMNFELVWKGMLEARIKGIGTAPPAARPRRGTEEVLDEILNLVRGLAAKQKAEGHIEAVQSAIMDMLLKVPEAPWSVRPPGKTLRELAGLPPQPTLVWQDVDARTIWGPNDTGDWSNIVATVDPTAVVYMQANGRGGWDIVRALGKPSSPGSPLVDRTAAVKGALLAAGKPVE